MLGRRGLILLAAGGSLVLLLAAFGFQHLGGLAPCQMCLWQRWPHAAAVAFGVFALALGGAIWLWLGLLSALTTAGIGGYHTGVERGWWDGPASCAGGAGGLGGSGADMLSLDVPALVVQCDEVVWSLVGLSMASWNMLAALVLAAIWALALCKSA
ncbi:disulfide bond formation protein B [Roseovarius sp. LXJ103]|uniref:disulfide bond formation protein B n=1 Tax=Roseovarius carneus TaxID=2853164 RepID=UPI000D6038C0|nr:disulfide bond formation protein B [Roseovarius carneus]MBZ8119511.1 disulfide bond formation protein B [Roseovarius carneus]PWE34861.1 disulfide bond formation protein B [Pelagicola sp. LXJ1103]